MELNFSFQALMYNITGAYYKCSLDNNVCKVKLLFMRTSTALLTTPGTEEVSRSFKITSPSTQCSDCCYLVWKVSLLKALQEEIIQQCEINIEDFAF